MKKQIEINRFAGNKNARLAHEQQESACCNSNCCGNPNDKKDIERKEK